MIQDDVIREDEEAPVHGEEEATQEGAPRNENERGENFGPEAVQMEVSV